jgi:hypothetical protein
LLSWIAVTALHRTINLRSTVREITDHGVEGNRNQLALIADAWPRSAMNNDPAGMKPSWRSREPEVRRMIAELIQCDRAVERQSEPGSPDRKSTR